MDADVQKEINELRAALQHATVALQMLLPLALKVITEDEDRQNLVEAVTKLSEITHPGAIRGLETR